ncbi:MAG: N-acetylmuramoyl-L-alanine amidase [Caulobacteraceae bacterium]
MGCLAFAGVSHGAALGASWPRTRFSAPLKLRFGGDAASTRVVLELSEAATAEVISDGAADGHVVLNFSKLSVGDSLDGQGKGLVKAWSIDKARGHARLSLDLAAHGRIKRRFLLPPSDGVSVYRYVMDIEADGAAAPAPAKAAPPRVIQTKAAKDALPPPIAIDPEAPEAALEKASLPDLGAIRPLRKGDVRPRSARTRPPRRRGRSRRRPSAPVARKVIVIDAGHGGHDPGALGGRSHEKDVTLAAAKTLKARLERSGRFKVVMTRDSDVYIPLEQRVKIARGSNADLFISLHADSGGDPKVRGATVYTLSDHGVDRATRSVFNGGFINVQLPGKDLSVKQILLDLTQRTTRNRSGAFAETLLEKISAKTPLLRRSHRDAGYMVLLAPDVPAVLLEMGFITNPDDETNLNDREKRVALMGHGRRGHRGLFRQAGAGRPAIAARAFRPALGICSAAPEGNASWASRGPRFNLP